MIDAMDGQIYRLEMLRSQLLAAAARKPKQRVLTDEGRKRIAEAQHRRWSGVRLDRDGAEAIAAHF